MSTKITKKEIIKELIRCTEDPIYFIESYARIQHPVKGSIPFKLYPYQKDVIRGLIDNRKNIILKARQLGITTVTAALMSWFILFHKDKNVLVVATKQEVAKTTIRVIKNIFKYIPSWMRDLAQIKVDNRNSVELANGSRVKAVTTTDDVGRSEAVSWLVCDEAAHIPKFDEIWTGVAPTISTGGRVALFSSPNGVGNFFHHCWTQAKNNENGFNCRFGTYVNPNNPNEIYNDRLMWWVHPEHDLTWFKAETKDKSPRDVAQEYECNYNQSGDTFILGETITHLQGKVSEHKESFSLDRNLWIWEYPDKNGTYLISADVSSGDAADYSAFHVLRLDTHPLVQVAEYKAKIKPDQLGILLIAASKYYNNATIAPENNSGWSGQTILKIEEANYPFLYYSRRRKPTLKNDATRADPYYASMSNDFLPGYSVTSANRIQMLAKLEQYLRLEDIKINSMRFIDELKTFIVASGNRPEAVRGESDDLIMALAGGLWVREEAYLYTYRSDDMTKAMLAGMSTGAKTTQNLDGFYNGTKNYLDRGRVVEHLNDQYKVKTVSGDTFDISWLITKG
jgi:hypothetical protein